MNLFLMKVFWAGFKEKSKAKLNDESKNSMIGQALSSDSSIGYHAEGILLEFEET